MPDRLPVGPYRTISLDDGTEVPFYVIPFDRRGLCEAPKTRRHLVDELAGGDYSDVFFFSHGWNNDWTVATNRYEHFLAGFMAMRRERDLPVPAGYKPLLVGVHWPSTALVFTEAEKGPDLQAGDPEAVDEAVSEERREIAELAAGLDAAEAEEFYRLAQQNELDDAEARRLAEIAISLYDDPDDELGLDSDVSVDDLLENWATAPGLDDDLDEFVAAGGGGPGGLGAGAAPAGIGDVLKKLDPRPLVRALTVYKMKDRAGKVGANGVHRLLVDLLGKSAAAVHLIGHSYGAKVVLSATCAGTLPAGRKVRSMLLLQPAVSHLCFADKVPTTDRAGGYRAALERVENPIFSTFSRHDIPLNKLFHNAVRRKSDLGEQRIAAAGDPPSKYAALGGFGPRRAGEEIVDILDPGTDYRLDPAVEVYGLDGERTIGGHGDISNPSTYWALYTLASR